VGIDTLWRTPRDSEILKKIVCTLAITTNLVQ
jgi:hypothetical protein